MCFYIYIYIANACNLLCNLLIKKTFFDSIALFALFLYFHSLKIQLQSPPSEEISIVVQAPTSTAVYPEEEEYKSTPVVVTTVNPEQIVFTPSNWDTPQTVTVRAYLDTYKTSLYLASTILLILTAVVFWGGGKRKKNVLPLCMKLLL